MKAPLLRVLRTAWVRAVLGTLLAPIVCLAVAALLEPVPAALVAGGAGVEPGSVRVYDTHGRLLREVRADGGVLATPVTLSELPPEVPLALLAAEDARFFAHFGLDPLAMARAFGQALWHRRIVSGASTITRDLGGSARILSTMSVVVCAEMGTPVSGQCGWPTLAKSRRR